MYDPLRRRIAGCFFHGFFPPGPGKGALLSSGLVWLLGMGFRLRLRPRSRFSNATGGSSGNVMFWPDSGETQRDSVIGALLGLA